MKRSALILFASIPLIGFAEDQQQSAPLTQETQSPPLAEIATRSPFRKTPPTEEPNPSVSNLPEKPLTLPTSTLNGDWNAFVSADFIYWKARQERLEYLIPQLYDVSQAPITSMVGVRKPKFHSAPGFKVGLGVEIAHDNWDFFIQYTQLKPKTARDASNGTPSSSFWGIDNTTGGVVFMANVKWDLDFNVLDGEIGRSYYISNDLTLRPHIGFKGSWQFQHFSLKTLRRDEIDATDFSLRSMFLRQNQWGLGIRAGLNTTWQFNRYISLYGDIDLAGLDTLFKIERKDQDSANPTTSVFFIKDGFHALKLVVEWGIGIRCQWTSMHDYFHFLIQAGWEAQLWLKNNQCFNGISDFSYIGRGGDLSLQGLTIKAEIGF